MILIATSHETTAARTRNSSIQGGSEYRFEAFRFNGGATIIGEHDIVEHPDWGEADPEVGEGVEHQSRGTDN